MSFHLLKMAMVVAMTHGFRAIGRRAGPRLGGLALGLPCTTAVALVGSGIDRGVAYSVIMAETSLLGLVGAVALPLAYARSVERGWRLAWAPIVAVLAYFVAAIVARQVCPSGSGESLIVALVAVLTACALSGRTPLPVTTVRFRRVETSPLKIWALRTAVPVACLLASLVVGETAGARGAGLMSTFPGLTLTVLILTHLEAGPTAVVRMARALPPANLGMVAFLASFRLASPGLGLVCGTTLAYLAALSTLAVVARHGQRESFAFYRSAWGEWLKTHPPDRAAWPREQRRFRPRVESFTIA